MLVEDLNCRKFSGVRGFQYENNVYLWFFIQGGNANTVRCFTNILEILKNKSRMAFCSFF